ncbi:hypothetical protein LB504_011580 [Fusarium proliferatum]|nr:hypothetical protein LB504_011580 [Fusarium proliferatum]
MSRLRLTLLSAVSTAYAFVDLFYRILRRTLLFPFYVNGGDGLLDRRRWKDSVRLGPRGERFNGGSYIALDEESHWQDSWGDEMPNDDEGETTHNGTPQGDNNIRLELIENGSHGSEDTFPLATGLLQLSRQWEQANSRTWHHITIYETELPVKVRRFINVREDGDEKHVIIECNTYARKGLDQDLPHFHSAKNTLRELKLLDASFIAVRSKDNWKKLFLLQFHHACLRLFFEFFAPLELNERERTNDGNTDSGFAQLWQWNLRTITKRSNEYRDLEDMARELISTTESLIDIVRSSPPVVNCHADKFMGIDMELRGFCREANNRLQKFSDQIDHDLKYLELARSINQTRGVEQLTLLATVFLPLSLADGVLSMQTRFKDLGTLLYDFFGVVVLLATIVLIIMILLNLKAVVNEVDSKLSVRSSGYREDFRGKVLLTIKVGFGAFGCLVLSSFLVGMFKDVSLGAKILGYGVAATFGLLGLSGYIWGNKAMNESTSMGALVMVVVL